MEVQEGPRATKRVVLNVNDLFELLNNKHGGERRITALHQGEESVGLWRTILNWLPLMKWMLALLGWTMISICLLETFRLFSTEVFLPTVWLSVSGLSYLPFQAHSSNGNGEPLCDIGHLGIESPQKKPARSSFDFRFVGSNWREVFITLHNGRNRALKTLGRLGRDRISTLEFTEFNPFVFLSSNDIFSVRILAHFLGICGLDPSSSFTASICSRFLKVVSDSSHHTRSLRIP